MGASLVRKQDAVMKPLSGQETNSAPLLPPVIHSYSTVLEPAVTQYVTRLPFIHLIQIVLTLNDQHMD